MDRLEGGSASPVPWDESVWAINRSLERNGARVRCRACLFCLSALFPSYRAFKRHAHPRGSNFCAICRHFGIDSVGESASLDALTLQCHMPGMSKIKTICVYCGSGPGANSHFIEAAIALGRILAENHIRLVYGGGSIGLMGALATSALDHGGTVTGIIPDFLTARENALTRVQELVVTPDMHERKRLMFERSDAFVALPGGVGT